MKKYLFLFCIALFSLSFAQYNITGNLTATASGTNGIKLQLDNIQMSGIADSCPSGAEPIQSIGAFSANLVYEVYKNDVLIDKVFFGGPFGLFAVTLASEANIPLTNDGGENFFQLLDPPAFPNPVNYPYAQGKFKDLSNYVYTNPEICNGISSISDYKFVAKYFIGTRGSVFFSGFWCKTSNQQNQAINKPRKLINVSNENAIVCNGESITFQAGTIDSNDQIGFFKDAACTIPYNITNTLTLNSTQYTIGINKFWVKIVNSGCLSVIKEVSFTVNESPTNLVVSGNTGSYCNGSPILISPSANGSNLTYEWSTTSNFVSLLGSNFVDAQGRLSYIADSNGAKTFYVRAKSPTGCTTPSQTVNFNVITGISNLTIANSGKAFCDNLSISFTAGSTGATEYQWFKDSAGAIALGTGTNLSLSNTDWVYGTNTIYVRASNSACSTTLIAVPFTVNKTPSNVQTTGNTGTYCIGNPVLVTPTAVGDPNIVYEWSTSTNFVTLLDASFVDNAGRLSYTPNTSGTYTYYVRAKSESGSCYSSTYATVTLVVSNLVSSVTVTPINPSICFGQNVVFTASAQNATSYSWSSDPLGTNVIGTGSTITLDQSKYTLGSNTIYLTVGNTGGCNATATPVAFVVNATPSNLVVTGNLPQYCTGTPILISPASSGSGISYEWSTNSNFTTLLGANFVDNAGNLSYVPTQVGQTKFYVRATNGSCFSNTVEVNYQVNAGVTNLQVSNNGATFCSSDQISFTAGAVNSTTYNWYKFANATGLIYTGATFTPTASQYVLGLNTVYIQASNGNGCSTALQEVTYTVNSAPTNLQTTGNQNNYCVGNPLLITPSASYTGLGTVTYQWSTSSNFAIILGPTFVDFQGRLNFSPSNLGLNEYYVRAKSPNGCYSNFEKVSFTVNTNVGSVSITNQNAIVCNGSDVTFSIGAQNATGYAWYKDSLGTIPISTSQTLTISPSNYVIGANVVYAQAKGAGNCNSQIVAVNFKVNEAPTNLVLTGNQSSYCLNSQINVQPSSTGSNLVYQWSTNANFTTLLGSTFVDSAGNLNYVPGQTGNFTYYVRSFNGSCYSNVVTYTFSVVTGVGTVQVSNNGASFCAGNTFSFTAGATGATTFNWYKFANGTGLLATGATYSPSATDYVLDIETTIYVQASNGNGCNTSLIPVKYTVFTKPSDLQIVGNSNNYCIGNQILIEPSASSGSGTLVYEWSTSSNFATLLPPGFVDTNGNLNFVASGAGSYTYFVRAKSPSGCVSTTGTVSFTVSNAVSNVTITPLNAVICNGQNITFTASAQNATSYSWSTDALGVNIIGSNSTLTLDQTKYVLGLNKIFLKVGNAGGCNVNPIPVSFTVNDSPTNLEITGNLNSYCTGSPVLISPSATGTDLVYEWSINSNFTTILGSSMVDVNGNLSFTPSIVGNVILYVRAKNSSGCATLPKTVTFLVNQGVSNLQVTNNGATFCSTDQITFTAGAVNGNNFSWYKFSNGTGLLSTGATFTLSANQYTIGANTIYVQASSGNNCNTELKPITFTVNQVPTNLEVSGNQNTYCIGSNVLITPSANIQGATITYEWSTTANFANVLGSNFVDANGNLAYSPSSAGNFTYYVRAKGTGSCYSTSKTVTFIVSNAVSNVTITPQSQTVCYGVNVTFSASAQNATSYTWSTDSAGANVISSNPTVTILPANYTVGLNTIFLKIENAGGCNVNPIPVTFTINAAPTNLVLTGAQDNYCSGSQILITPSVTGAGTVTYEWSTNSNFSIILGANFVDSDGRLNYVPNNTANNTFYCRAVNSTGCYSNVQSVTFTVTQGVSNLQVSNENGNFCVGQSFNFTAGATGASLFNWYKFPNGTGLLFTGATYTPSPADYQLGANTIYLQALSSNNSCSSAIRPINFTVNASPTGIAFVGNTTYCQGQNVFIQPSALGTNLTYQWATTSNFASGNILGSGFVDNAGNLSYVSNNVGSVTYYVRAFNGSCYSDGIPVTITVNTQPTSLAVTKLTNTTSNVYCQNAATELYLATGVNVTKFKWYNDSALTQEVLASYVTGSNGNTLNVNPSLWTVGAHNVFVVGENINGCTTVPVLVNFTIISGITAVPASANNFSICQSETKVVTLDNPNNFTITWYTNSAGTQVLNSSYVSNNGNTLTILGSNFNTGNTTLYYKVENAGGCTSVLQALSFTVLNSPTGLAVTNNNTSICESQNIVFEASGQNVNEYKWYKDYATGLVVNPQLVDGTNNNRLTIPSGSLSPGIYNYQVVALNTSGCSTLPLNVTFTVKAVPGNPSIVGATSYCQNENVSFALTNSTVGGFKWFTDANTLIPLNPLYVINNGSNVIIPASTYNPGTYTLYYYATNQSCNGTVKSITFTVKQSPTNLNVSGNQGSYCFGNEIDIVVGSTGGATNYQWFEDANASLQLNPNFIIGNTNERLKTTLFPVGIHTVYVRATNANACNSDLLPITFTVNAKPVIASFTATPGTVVEQSPIVFNVVATGYTKWRILFNGNQVSPTGNGWNNGTINNFTLTNSANLNQEGIYTLQISNGTCEDSKTTQLYVLPKIIITHNKLDAIGDDNGITKVILTQHDLITFTSNFNNSLYDEEWIYGDGFINTTVAGSHYYNIAGEFPLVLRLKNKSTGDIFNYTYEYPILVKPINGTTNVSTLNPPDTSYTIYPNPTKEFLGLKFTANAGDKMLIRIFNISGLSVFNADWVADGVSKDRKWYNPLINTPSGTFIVVINNITQGTVYNAKLLKQ